MMKKLFRINRTVALFGLAAWLSACQTPDPAKVPPIADAGVGRVAVVGAVVTLDGSKSHTADGQGIEVLEFEWSIVASPTGSTSALNEPDSATPTIEIDVAGDFVFHLSVTYDGIKSRPAVVMVRGYRPLEVTSQTPPVGAWGVPQNAPVVVEFSLPVQPETITDATFFVLNGRALLPGTLAMAGGNTLAVFVPSQAYPQGTQLTVVVAQGVVAVSGETLPAAYQGHFEVTVGADVVPPFVIDFGFPDGVPVIPSSSVITVTFSESIDPHSARVDQNGDRCPDNFVVLDSNGDCVPGSVEVIAGGTRAIFTPESPFVPGETYTVTMVGQVGGITDVAGNPLEEDSSITFSITDEPDDTPPRVSTVYPGPGFEDVPLGVRPVITFSEPMWADTAIAENISLSDGILDMPVTADMSFGNRVLTLLPDRQLEPATYYTLTLRGDGLMPLADASGIALDGDGDGIPGGDFVTSFVTTGNQTYDGEFTLPGEVEPGQDIFIMLSDRDLDTTVTIDSVVIEASSATGEIESLILTETNATSGVFEGSVATTPGVGPGTNDDGVFLAARGDTITFWYDDELSAAGVPRVVSQTVDVTESQAAITVSAISRDTNEAGRTATFAVVLNLVPTADVIISFNSSDLTEGTVAKTSLTFTQNNWNAPQIVIVTGVDDSIRDGNQSYQIVFGNTVSDDGNYSGITPAPVDVINVDDESAGFTVSPISGPTTEAGGTAMFTVVLNSEPSADVTVHYDSNDTSEGTVAVTSLTFTSLNWNAPQGVTVTGADDAIADGHQSYSIIFGATTSSDSDYAAIVPASVNVVNIDNESAGFLVSPISGPTSEAGGTASFAVVLTSQPTADVTVNLNSNDVGEGVVGTTSLTFTPLNWNAPQHVTVTGVDDAVADGNQPFVIVFGPTVSLDLDYRAIRPTNVTVINIDNDSAGITTSAISANTTEGGGQAFFTVVLNSEPTADVQITFSSSDPTEATVSPTSLTFTSVNWAGMRTITVTGVNDDVADGNQLFTVDLAPATSLDGDYNGLTVRSIDVVNVDNDSAGFMVSPTAGLVTDEGAAQATFTVVLTSEPTADVVIALSSSAPDEGTVSPASLTFTATSWAGLKTVTVTGVNDDVADGNQPYTINLAPAVSGDSNYNNADPPNVSVTNTDDDSAGFTVSPISGLSTDENGAQAIFTVVLTSQPTHDVFVNISSSDVGEGTVSPTTLTFTASNWAGLKTVTITGVNDDVADGNIGYSIVLDPATSSDGGYNGLDPPNVSVTNVDDDSAGFAVTPVSGLTTGEDGTQATFTVRLTSEPIADVVVPIASTDTTEGLVSTAALTFTAANWAGRQTVTVTGQNDDVDDGNISYTIQLSVPTTTDGNYAALNPPDVSVSNVDDDSAGFTVTPTVGLTTGEDGTQATFTVVLTSQPTADVVVPISSSNTFEGTVSPSSLTFTPASWAGVRTVTVTGVDDSVADGNIGYTAILGVPITTGANYAALDPPDVSVTNIDNDTAGITVSAAPSLTTTEGGGQATFTVVLTSQPTADVVIGLSSSDTTEGTVSPASLTFTAGTWAGVQTVTVTGVNDDLADGNIGYSIILAAAVSSDTTGYSGMDAADVTVANTDNDTAGISVTAAPSLTTTEGGGQATFTVVLRSQPTADVVIGLSSSDLTEGTVSPTSLTFTSGTWAGVRTVTVTGVDDDLADGNIGYSIVLAAAVSDDTTGYSGMDGTDVAVRNTDNDSAGITVSPTSGLTTTEGGSQATFTVVLTSQPTADVVIGLSSSDPTEGTVSSASLTFTAGTWAGVQTVTVTGVNDDLADGNVGYSIVLGAAVSADTTGYSGMDATDVSVSNTDNDTAGITVTPTTGLTTTEGGGQATFTVVLTSQPTADVVIGLSSSDLTEGTVSPASLTFTAGTWAGVQTVTVTGVNDALADGNIGYSIVLAAAVSSDTTGYSDMNATDVAVSNTDNDSAGITVTAAPSLTTTEDGGQATFTVVLTSQPTADVVIGLSSSDLTEGTVSPTNLTFTAGTWAGIQTVTVTGVDDDLADGNIGYSIVLAAAVSTDTTGYSGMDATDVAVRNTDNDSAGITVSPTSGLTTTEGGSQATFTVVLTSQPTADVIIGLSSSDTTEGTVSPASLTFTAGTWAGIRTVTVTGVNDDLADGNIGYSIVLASAVSTDTTGYSGMDGTDVLVTNTDNDIAGITVSPTSGLVTTEGGSQATFTVVLTSQPTADVVIGLSSSDTTEGTVSPASLTFTAGTWAGIRTVTVTGVNDDLADGNIGYSIILAPAVSSDTTGYGGMDATDVAVSNTDNDSAGITVTAAPSLTTTEGGSQATFTVVLTSQPTADVVIGLSSSDTTEGTVSPSSLTFTAGTWAGIQTVTVTGVDDDLADGNIGYSIVLASAVSTDTTGYSGMDATDVSVTNTDNDSAGITVTAAPSLTTTEGGGQATFTVVLTSQPTADVVIGLSSSDTTEGTVSPASLTFTAGTWAGIRTVTVTGVNDDLADGNIGYSIVLAAAVSTDTTGYSGMDATDVSVRNTDNDSAGITVTAAPSLTTTEDGGQATFTVVLTSQPTADVVIGLSSSDPTEGTVSPASLTFTTGTWAGIRTVTVTGVNDDLADGNVGYSIVLASAVSTDTTGYSGMDPTDVSVTNTDNDTAGITVTAAPSLATTEDGGQATFTVVLTSQPTADVVIGLSSSDTTEGTVSPGSLTFTAGTWAGIRTVTVTGVNDDLADGTIGYSIVLAAAVSSDTTGYSGMDATDVTVTNTDNDTAGITVSPTTGLTTTEGGSQATFTVVLTSQPTADVVIGLSSSDLTEGTVSPSSLTFTAGTWAGIRTVTVTGVNDDLADGNIGYSIVLAAAVSSDTTGYSGMDATDVAVRNTDNDIAGITVSPTSGLTTTEGGSQATFTVVLTSQPTADVVIGLTSSDTTEGTVSPASLTFTTGTWAGVQTVTVTGVNDALADGNIGYSIVLAAAVSSDTTGYNGMDATDVTVSNTDNDIAGITVSPTSGLTTTEGGSQATFTVVLTSQPTADVVIGLTSSDTTEGTVSPASLTFTTGTWAGVQTVTVTGVNDALADGNIGYSIVLAAAVSSDTTGYSGMDATDVTVTNTDNDIAGITVTPTLGLVTTEGGSQATFTVVLTSQPTADVVIGLTSSDTTEGTVSPSSLTFTSGTWAGVQTVTVTGVNDALADGNVGYSIVLAAAVSSDTTGYSGMDATDVLASNTDNDIAGITVSPTSGLTTTEGGGQATFTVVLTSQPTADVVIGLTSSDTTEGTVSPTSLTFTPGTWAGVQTVTVTGVNDALADGNVGYSIVLAAAVSGDTTGYSGRDATDVTVSNTDNDIAGITVTAAPTLTTTEGGGQATFTVVLTSQPTADVVIGLTSSDTTEGTVSPSSLTFTSGTWAGVQTVTVTGVNDAVADGNISYSIVLAPAVSTDTTGYSGMDATDVSASNTDNDIAGITVTPISGLTTTEGGGQATFTVVLTSQPTANVVIPLSSNDTTEGTVSPASLTFTSGTWAGVQTVTVTGVNDAVADGNVGYSIVLAAAVSSDTTGYSGRDATDVSVSNTDNDIAGITVTAAPTLTTTEGGGQDTFTVVLTSQPTADVVIPLSSNDTTEGTVSPSSLTFTPGTWAGVQTVTVTGVNDAVADGNIGYSIVLAAAVSSDTTGYSGRDATDVSVSNTDNDTAGITVSPTSGLTTTEGGGQATFTVVLTSQPTADVVIGLTSSDTTEGTVSPASLTFTAGTWAGVRTVTVTGVNDALADGNIGYSIVLAPAVSSDTTGYSGRDATDVTLTNTDNDMAGITVTPTSGLTTTEDATTATFTVVLTSQPTADVVIPVSSSNTAEGTVDQATLTFSPTDWAGAQTVTITGVDDAFADGNIAYSIILGAATSGDTTGYNGMDATDVSVSNTDNDTAGITVSPTSGLVTTEAGGTATFTVVLTSQPTASVQIPVSSLDTSEGTVSPSTLTFTTGDWGTPKTVTVTGVDDAVDDGNVSYTVQLAAAVSTDTTGYSGRDATDVSVSNTDNDTAGITVNPTSGLVTTEAGPGTATFTVVLQSQPTATVTIPVASLNAAEATVSTALLTFTTGDWGTPKTVTVTGVDDAVDDGNIGFTIQLAAASSTDLGYNNMDPTDVTGTNNDDDLSGYTVSPTSGLVTTESGGTAQFTVVLNSQPTATVTIPVTSSDTGEGTVSPSSLVFSTSDWDMAQTVTVTGVDDSIDDGNVAYFAVLATPTTTDAIYGAQNPPDVSITNNDNGDVAGVTVSPTSGLITSEAGGTAQFTVVLNTQPEAQVTIPVTSLDTSEGTVSAASLVFDGGNWNTPQTVTVTGVNDFIDDNNVVYTIELGAATSTDTDYGSFDPSDVSVTNNDDADAAGVTVSPTTGLTTTEVGGTAQFTVVLTSQPTALVTIPIASSNTSEGTIPVANLTFDAGSWSTAQTITITGQNDLIDDGDMAYTITLSAATSTDGGYNGMNPDDVSVTNTDNDTGGITVSPTSGLTTTEAGGTAQFTVVLDTEPTAQVQVPISSSDTGEGTVSPTTLTFDSGNWSTAQTVTITGVNDDVDDDDQVYTVIVAQPSVGDTVYTAINPADVSVTNTDNDTAAITVDPTSGLTTGEDGTFATFTVVLATQPTADVTIGLSSSNSAEGVPAVASLTFTSGDWSTIQTVTVNGVDDDIDDIDATYTIVLAAAVSTDTKYNTMNPTDVSATNVDDDTAGITVSPTSGLVTSEDGNLNPTFTVVLESEPIANVTIGVSSDNVSEGTPSPTFLVFTSADWFTAQTVTVTGVDDGVVDGSIGYTILVAAPTTGDGKYAAINPADVSVTNNDNDVVGVTVNPTSGLVTTEVGGTAQFTVVLTSQPSSDVTMTVASSDVSEGTVSTALLTFTSGDWDTAQTVTITGVNDFIDDGDVAYTILIGTTASADAGYNATINPADPTVTNTDNDAYGITVSPTSGLITNENGLTDTFTVVLDSEPLDDVSMSVASSDTTEGTVSVASLTFTPGNWNVEQTVTITGQDDVVQEVVDPTYSIIIGLASSTGDSQYNGTDPTDPSVTNMEVGTNGTPDIIQATFTNGFGILVRVLGDTDEWANETVGGGNDDAVISVTLTSSVDSETFSLNENGTIAGDFDCTVDGCLFPTVDSATGTTDDGTLQINGAETVTLSYTDLMRADGSSSAQTDTAISQAPGAWTCLPVMAINEVVTDPQSDWSGSGFTSPAGVGTIDTGDEWIEIVNLAGCAIDLTHAGSNGFIIQMLGGLSDAYELNTGLNEVYSAGSAASFTAGAYLVVGAPASTNPMDGNIWIRLEEPGGGIIDQVALGTSLGGDDNASNNAPAGTSTGTGDEAVYRSPDGTGAWSGTNGSATIGGGNP